MMVKKSLAMLLCLALFFSVAACSVKPDADVSTEPESETVQATEESAAEEAVPTVTEPVTIQIWHSRGTGKNGDMIAASVKEFNETNTLGITVEEVYQGGNYNQVLSKTLQAINAGTQPEIVILSFAGLPYLVEQGVMADMKPFIERDNVDMSNFVPSLLEGYSYYGDQIVSLPYIRSVGLYYYNKTMFDEAGVAVPTTIQELESVAPQLTDAENGVSAFEMLIDSSFYMEALVNSLGSSTINAEGKKPECLYDGTLLQVYSDWRSWVDAGWCVAPVVTNASSSMQEAFYSGKLASFFASSGSMGDILANAEAAGFEVGVSSMIGYDKYVTPTGGGSLGLIEKNNSDNEIAAAWEFIKFLMSDEQVAANTVSTGYLPVTYSSIETDTIQQAWQETPQLKVAFDALSYGDGVTWSVYRTEWNSKLNTITSKLIQDKSIDPEEAVSELDLEGARIFPVQ